MRKALATALVSVGTVLVLSGCNPPQGPAGTVADKEIVHNPATKTNERYLTVRKPSGTTARFLVNPGTYDTCRRGSAYPTCDNR
ncbi:hypothetical protein [Streptomyces phaeochromogenes]